MRSITLLLLAFICLNANAQVSLTGTTYTENFNTLAATSSSTVTPSGWSFVETGTNANIYYTAGTGSSNTGDTYSFGSTGSTERALGTLRSGSLISTIGASFTNNTGNTITSLTISFTGEEWRFGATGRADRLDFQYSTNATTLSTGTWIDVNALDFSSPNLPGSAGALDGNAAINRTAISYTITDLSIPAGTTFFIRFTDFDAVSSDDGLAIDDFSLSTGGTVQNTVSVASGSNAAEPSINGSFTINFSAPTTSSTDIDFSFGGTATFGSDYTVSYSIGSTSSTSSTGTLTLPAGVSQVTVTVTPVNDALVEGNENISLTLSNPTQGYIISGLPASITLADDDYNTVSVAAGTNAAEPSTAGTFTLNLSSPAPAGGVTITYSLSGSATAGTDYADANNGTLFIPAGSSTGSVTLTVIDDNVYEGTETISITLLTANANYNLAAKTATINLADDERARVVINQVYGGGGNSGADYKYDFIELFNNENFPVDLNGWSLNYSSAGGTGNWNKNNLTGIIPPHSFFLVQEAIGGGGTLNLPTPDAIGTLTMAASSGKVVLSNSTATISGANPTGSNIIDKVGFGLATGYETAPTPVLDNTTAAKRNVDGVDTDNNAADFVLGDPEPRNSSYTTTPPVVTALSPADNSTGIPYNTETKIIFSKPIQKGTGNITINENGSPTVIDINSPGVIVSYKTVTINTTFTPGSSYEITIDAGAIKDLYNNDFAGLSAGDWNFSIYNSTAPQSLPVSYTFDNCSGAGMLTEGFTQFSETGAQKWDCSQYGRSTNAVEMNGYANGTNSRNIDWLISPSINLTGTTYPLLSFWSRTAFNGDPLQLVVSTDYPGTGDPRNYTWTEINGKFPAQTSNTWTESAGINLSHFKGGNVHFAFIYTSSDDDGARWTVDDISIVNSETPPPPSLTVATTDVQFGFVAKDNSSDKTFSFIGNDLVDPVTITTSGDFLVSKDGISFSPSVTYSVAEASDNFINTYVRFTPSVADQNFTGSVSVATSTLSGTVSLKGTSIDPATTLEVVNWNMEWFGSTTLGPTNDDQQEQNAETILKSIGADIYGVVEVVDESRLQRVVSHMPGYSYVIGNYGSHVNPPDPTGGPLSEAQKLAVIYKTDMFSNITSRPLINAAYGTSSYSNWSSGRYPFLFTADMTLAGVTKRMNFVVLHAKANTSPTATAYARREASANELHDTLNTIFGNENVIVLGDFNDDLDKSITDGFITTSYHSFTDDPSHFFSPTLALSLAGKKSTVKYSDMIDHVMLSNEFQPYYIPNSATVLTDVAQLVSNYGTTTTDHYPVFTRYMFCKLTAPENITVSNDTGACGATVTFTVGSTMTCGTVAANPVSGSFFPIGATTVTVTSSTGEELTFTVTVNDIEKPAVIAPAAITADAEAGKCSIARSALDLGTAIFGDNCAGATISNDAPEEFPVGTTTITYTVTDAVGNTATATQEVVVSDKENPSITAPSDITVSAATGTCAATVSLGTATAADNCGSVTVTNDAPASLSFTVGLHTITWTSTDSHGNTSTATQQVTVTDDQSPVITNCPAVPVQCFSATGKYAIPKLTATDNCGVQSIAFSISGATSRSGNGDDASGAFNVGESTITWTVTDLNNKTATCTTRVVINSQVTSTLNNPVTVQGGAANTIYIGYGPSSITMNATAMGGTAPYSYKWTVGSSAGQALNNTASYTVSPSTATTYYFNVKDTYGCSALLQTKTINVIDVRCGAKMDKVTICQVVKGKQTTSCVMEKDVASYLANGATLGACAAPAATTRVIRTKETAIPQLLINASPNPTTEYFTVNITTGNSSEGVQLKVLDVLGRTIESRQNITTPTLTLGQNYKQGVYIIEITQGHERAFVKVLKRR